MVEAEGQPTPGPFKFCIVFSDAMIRSFWSSRESPNGKLTGMLGLLTACPAATLASNACKSTQGQAHPEQTPVSHTHTDERSAVGRAGTRNLNRKAIGPSNAVTITRGGGVQATDDSKIRSEGGDLRERRSSTTSVLNGPLLSTIMASTSFKHKGDVLTGEWSTLQDNPYQDHPSSGG